MYKNIKIFLLLALCFFVFVNKALSYDNIYQLNSRSLSDKLQIFMEVDNIPNYHAFSLSQPIRIVLDIKAQAATSYQNNLNFKKRGVLSVRTSMLNADTVRLVLQLNRNYKWKVYPLPATVNNNPRIVIDIYDGHMKNNVVAKKRVKKMPKIILESINIDTTKKPLEKLVVKNKGSTKKSIVKNKIIKETTAKSIKQRNIIVVIDPGHGGKDSGAVGKYRTLEKVVVLQIAKRLKKKIDAIKGMQAKLTRSTDRYISLRGRLRLARKYKADLFVSIHADASLNHNARGSSVYILSNRGASSESARWLARRENAVDLKYGVDIGDYDKDVSNMIMHIQQDATIESSNSLAKKTIQHMKYIGKVHKPFVERAGFAVLKSPDIPSMLVETAFISNSREEKLLRLPYYQNKIATSIANGIRAYFAEYLPQHMLVR